jgi:intracellular septation protein A
MGQTFWFSVLTILPIVVFVLVDAFANARTAIWSAFASTLLALGLNIWLLKEMPHEPSILDWATIFAEPFFIFVLGAVSLKLSDSRFFKFQPVAVNAVMALLLLWGQVVGAPIFVKYFPAMEKAMAPDVLEALLQNVGGREVLLERLARTSHHMIYLFLLHGAVVAWAALKARDWVWVFFRILGLPLATLFMVAELLF